MKPIYVVYENDIGTNKHDQRLVTKAIYFAVFPLMSWKLETDSAWLTELKRYFIFYMLPVRQKGPTNVDRAFRLRVRRGKARLLMLSTLPTELLEIFYSVTNVSIPMIMFVGKVPVCKDHIIKMLFWWVVMLLMTRTSLCHSAWHH